MTHLLIECLTSDAPLLDLLQDLTWPARPAAATDTAIRPPVWWVAHLRNEPVLIPNTNAPTQALALHASKMLVEDIAAVRADLNEDRMSDRRHAEPA